MINKNIAAIILLSALGTASAATQNWTGFYVGAAAGYGWGEANDSINMQGDWVTDGTNDNTFLTPYATNKLNPNSFVGGAQAGYNYEIKHWVPGIAADFDYFGMSANYSSGFLAHESAITTNTYSLDSSFSSNWLITIRPRLGYAFGSFLPYITGGLAIANQKFSQNLTQLNLDYTENASLSNVGLGWTVGAGVEYALRTQWQLTLEYLYVDLPSNSVTTYGTFASVPVANYYSSHTVQLNANIIRAGLVYTFG